MATMEQTILYKGLCELLGQEPKGDFENLNNADALDVIAELKSRLNDTK